MLELGAGLGLVGLSLACLGADAVLTERPLALPLLRRNVEANGFTAAPSSMTAADASVQSRDGGFGMCLGVRAARPAVSDPTYSAETKAAASQEVAPEAAEAAAKAAAAVAATTAAAVEAAAVPPCTGRVANRRVGRRGSCAVAPLEWGLHPLPAVPRRSQRRIVGQAGREPPDPADAAASAPSGLPLEAPHCHGLPLSAALDERFCRFDAVVGADLAFPSNAPAFAALADTFARALGCTRGCPAAGPPAQQPAEESPAAESRVAGPLPPTIAPGVSCVSEGAESVIEGESAIESEDATEGATEGWLAHEARRPEVEAAFWGHLAARGVGAERWFPPQGTPCQAPEIGIFRLFRL